MFPEGMVFSRLIAAVAIGSAALAVASASAEPGSPAGEANAPVASVRLAECLSGREPVDRRAVFRGAMQQVSGARQMGMRFMLQEHVGDGGFRTVKAEGLGVWRKSRPGVRRFAYRQRVLALAQGASYRTVVSFRWYGADGSAIRRARRRSLPCRQPGRLPNLSIAQIAGGKPLVGAPGAVGYEVHVVNRGPVAAGRFGVSLAVDGAAVDTQTVAGLGAGKVRTLSFAGPACQGTVTARADPDDVVREAHDSDNGLTSPCPPLL